MRFLRRRWAQVLTIALLAQIGLVYGFSRKELAPANRPLKEFPVSLGKWSLLQEGIVEKEVQEVLRADDLLNRTYSSADGKMAGLFVAYFRSQRTGQAPHSPKNCLPGSGWVPSESGTIQVTVPGEPAPIEINRYLVQKGDVKSVVLYWYQSHNRIVASEYAAKFYVVADAIRLNRTDTALVRVVAPVSRNDEAGANESALEFLRAFFPQLKTFLPS